MTYILAFSALKGRTMTVASLKFLMVDVLWDYKMGIPCIIRFLDQCLNNNFSHFKHSSEQLEWYLKLLWSKRYSQRACSATHYFLTDFKHVKTGQKQNLIYAQRKSLGTILTLSALGFFISLWHWGDSTPFHKI